MLLGAGLVALTGGVAAPVVFAVGALGSIGSLTLASRVLGLVRDSLFARYVGAGFASDAFLVAFRLPNLFRALFAEILELVHEKVA